MRAVRVAPVASGDAWTLAEVLLHPAGGAAAWTEWMPPDLGWDARRAALAGDRRRDRADWYTRWALVGRHRP